MRYKLSGHSIWVYLGSIALGLAAFAVIVAAGWLLKPGTDPNGFPTAVVTVIFAPTTTPVPPEETAAPQETLTAVGQMIDGLAQGMYVQITNTGGDGLRLRRDPGTTSDILFLGYDAEVFKITGGPEIVDGYTWWYLTAPYDESRSGWAASNYLGVIVLETQQP